MGGDVLGLPAAPRSEERREGRGGRRPGAAPPRVLPPRRVLPVMMIRGRSHQAGGVAGRHGDVEPGDGGGGAEPRLRLDPLEHPDAHVLWQQGELLARRVERVLKAELGRGQLLRLRPGGRELLARLAQRAARALELARQLGLPRRNGSLRH